MNSIHLRHLLLMFLLVGTALSCKKDVKVDDNNGFPTIDKSNTYLSDERENTLRDSVLYYYKYLSLWENRVPPKDFAKFNESGYVRREYTRYFDKAEDILHYLMEATRNGQGGVEHYDRYSFIDRGGVISGELSGGVMTSFGFEPMYLENAESGRGNAFLYIKMVDVGSAAYSGGLKRGDRILSINDRTDIDYNTQSAQDFDWINSAINGQTIKLAVKRVDVTEPLEILLTSRSYSKNAILQQKVIDVGAEKVGYLAFDSFNELENSFGQITRFKSDMDDIFGSFESAHVTSLVIDLRYNGGGYVETAEYLANKIIPIDIGSKLMYTYGVNKYLTTSSNMKGEFDPVFYNKNNTLNLKKVYFLVSPSTASASELLMNVLKPYMPVVMIGTVAVDESGNTRSEKTYGKPVGFFGLDIEGALELYVTSFQMFNKDGYGNYFEGMTPDKNVREFLDFYDFGDPREGMLKAALQDISPAFGKQASLRSSSVGNARTLSVDKISKKRTTDIGMIKVFKK